MNQVYRVMGAWVNAADSTDRIQRFEGPNTRLGAYPITRADVICIAPYYEVNRSKYPTAQMVYNYKVGNTSAAFSALDAAFNSSGAGVISISDWMNTFCPFWAAAAKLYSVELHQYEGGWGVYPFADQYPTSYASGTGPVALSPNDTVQLWIGYKASSNWGTQLASALNAFKRSGGTFASNYWITSALWNRNNMFGIWAPNIFGVPAPYYNSSQPSPEKREFDAYNAS
jgi:hypothetical protein